jgi:FlaA1/EpsC-like NDP-sugar epimerase
MNLKKTPRLFVLTVVYAAFINASCLVSLLLRFEGDVPARYWNSYLHIAPAFTILSLFGYQLAGLYQGLWRYASTVTLFQILKGSLLSAVAMVGIMVFRRL